MNERRTNERRTNERAQKDEPEPVWRELFGNAGWLLYNGNAPFGIKAVVLRLAVGEIAELVGEDLRVTDPGIYIAMRVPVNPIIYTRISNIVTQLHRKSPIDSASLELGRSA